MTTSNLDKYIKLLNRQVKETLPEGELDILWYSLSETEQNQASAVAKVLSYYHKGR